MKAASHFVCSHRIPGHRAFNKCIKEEFVVNRIFKIVVVRIFTCEVRNKAGLVLFSISQLVRDLVSDHERFIEHGFGCIDLGFGCERIEISAEAKIMSNGTEQGSFDRRKGIIKKRIVQAHRIIVPDGLAKEKWVAVQLQSLDRVFAGCLKVKPLFQDACKVKQVFL